jgi:geranylgeranyl diphosphate synthase type I
MIRRKTAALIACSTEMGACLGTANQEIIHHLRNFGEASGIAFQIRDDLLGVWASSAESGKTPAGDIYRRKKSLPIIHALTHADARDHENLLEIYQQSDPISADQVDTVLEVMERTQTRAFCRQFLLKQCKLAYEALKKVPYLTNPLSRRAYHDLEIIVRFIEEAVY